VPDAAVEAARMGARQRRPLHRQRDRMAKRRGRDAVADRDPWQVCEQQRGLRHATGPLHVLDDPQLVESVRQCRRLFHDALGRDLADDHRSKAHAPCLSLGAVDGRRSHGRRQSETTPME
jgi:hypothetical protein